MQLNLKDSKSYFPSSIDLHRNICLVKGDIEAERRVKICEILHVKTHVYNKIQHIATY